MLFVPVVAELVSIKYATKVFLFPNPLSWWI